MKKISPFLEMVCSSNSSVNLKKFPSIKDKVNQLSNADADIIYTYLINGIEVVEFLSEEKDIFDRKNNVPTKVFTDGSYVWTMMIPHLVKNYKASLPKEFISHIKNQSKYANEYEKSNIDKILDMLIKNKVDVYLTFDDDE